MSETPTNDAAVDRVARAIKACTDTFDDPVDFYIRNEARHRFDKNLPDEAADSYMQEGVDWEFESYKIIARAAITAFLAAP